MFIITLFSYILSADLLVLAADPTPNLCVLNPTPASYLNSSLMTMASMDHPQHDSAEAIDGHGLCQC